MFQESMRRKPTVSIEDEQKRNDKRAEQLICGPIALVTPDTPVSAVVVDSIKSLIDLPRGEVLSFTPGKLLTMFLANAELFGVEPVVLRGFPGAEYTPAFDQATWGLTQISYDVLIAEISSTERVDRLREQQAGSRLKPRKREQSLTKDRVRHFSDFDSAPAEATDDSGS